MFMEMVGGDGTSFDLKEDPTATKKARVNASKSGAAKRKCNASRC